MLAHDLPQLSAALTYYTVLSLLPALIVVVALLGVVGLSADTVHSLLDTLGELGAPWAAQLVSDVLDSVLHVAELRRRAARQPRGLALGGVGLRRLLHGVVRQDLRDRRNGGPSGRASRCASASRWRSSSCSRRPSAVVTLVGPIGRWVADATGIGAGPLHLWTWIKWPLLIVLGLLLFTLLYKFTPSRRQPALWWLLARRRGGRRTLDRRLARGSASTSTTSPRTTVSTARSAPRVAFLVWAWLVNLALLVGVEVNREVEERRTGSPDDGEHQAAGPDETASV